MRLLCYNIGVIIEQAFEAGIYPTAKSAKKVKGDAVIPGIPESSREFIGGSQKESVESGQPP
jgi:hypothetical protein